jgi:hypothetical protein
MAVGECIDPPVQVHAATYFGGQWVAGATFDPVGGEVTGHHGRLGGRKKGVGEEIHAFSIANG